MAEGTPMTLIRYACLAAAAAVSIGAVDAPAAISVVPAPAGQAKGQPLPLTIGGRVDARADGYHRQWPGTYFDAAFDGSSAQIAVGPGDVVLNVTVDGRQVAQLVKPRPGLYAITGLSRGRHAVRVQVASESQAGPTVFGGIFAGGGTRALPAPVQTRQIEFIGDSHTVGYGNTSSTRDCTEADVWRTTDTSRGVPAVLAQRYRAAYQVNAISGRGIVRNYDNLQGDTVPVAHPYTLFDKARAFVDPTWHPRLIVIALGTNDFSTPLKPGEPWKTRADLHADYESRYVGFVRRLRARDPQAHILLWATDLADGEIAREVGKVTARLDAAGIGNVGFVAVKGLSFSGCHFHPSVADDRIIADRLAAYVDAHPGLWSKH